MPETSDPKVTIALFTYNQEQWVRASLESVLAQDYANLEIIVSDDASSDGTVGVIESVLAEHAGSTQAEVRLVARQKNLRREHTPTIGREATGDLVVIAHGDDLSFPDRVSKVVEVWKATRSGWVGCNAIQVDADGRAAGPYLPGQKQVTLGLSEVAGGWRGEMLGATGAFEPSLFTDPAFIPTDDVPLPGGWDHILPFRAALRGEGLSWTPEPLVAYRRHPGQRSREINDWTAGNEVWEETLRAHSLPVLTHLRHELQHYLKHHPERADLRRFAPVLDQAVLQFLDDWARIRSQLRSAGWKTTWLSRDELAMVQAARKGRQ